MMSTSSSPSPGDNLAHAEADLFRGGSFVAEEKEKLLHNPVFRLLVKRQAAERGRRLGLILAFTLGFFVFTGFYFRLQFHWSLSLALVAACSVGVSFTLVLASLFIFGGISGYESMLQIVRNAGDIIPTPIPPGDVALALWASTARLFSPSRDRLLSLAAASTLVALLAIFRAAGGSFIFCWMLLPAAVLGFLLAASAHAFAHIGLPGSRLWIGGVSRASLKRISASPARARSTVSRTVGNLLSVGVIVTIVAAVAVYFRIGVRVEQTSPPGVANSIELRALALAAGGLILVLGTPIAIWTLHTARRKAKYLASISDLVQKTLDAIRIRQNEVTSDT